MRIFLPVRPNWILPGTRRIDHECPAGLAHTRDPSGCTAVAALVTHDNKIYVVCRLAFVLSYRRSKDMFD